LQVKELKIVCNIEQPDGGIQLMKQELDFIQESKRDREKRQWFSALAIISKNI